MTQEIVYGAAEASMIPQTAMYENVSLWLTCGGETFHYACGPRAAVYALANRYRDAKVAKHEIGECCMSVGGLCAFDQFCDEEDARKQMVAGHALARVEGRTEQTFEEWCRPIWSRYHQRLHLPLLHGSRRAPGLDSAGTDTTSPPSE